MVNTKDEEVPKGVTSSPNVSQESDSPPSPAAAAAVVTAEEVREQMTVIVCNSFGGLKNVKVAKRSVPAEPPAEKSVNVKVIMSGVSFQDIMARLGVMDSSPTPFVMGSECVGKVTAVGEGVTSVKVDDLVYALPDSGAWAEQATVPEHLVWLVDQNVSVENLACTLAYLVADLLLGEATLTPNSTILVHSAGGSVGIAVKDLAKDCKVIGIASKGKIEKLEGFSSLIERGSDYVAEIRKSHPSGIDLILDSQGGEDCARGISVLASGGRYVLFGSANIVSGETKSFFTMAKSWWQVEKISPLKLFEENKTVGGLHLRQFLKGGDKKEFIGQKLSKIWKLMAEGKIHPVIDSTLNFREVTEGMSKLHDRKNIGKILLNFEDPKPVAAPIAENSDANSA